MTVRYCLPIRVAKINEAENLIAEHDRFYSSFEIWVDYLEDYSLQALLGLSRHLGERLILLFRRDRLEAIRLPLKDRLALMEELTSCGSFLDLDLTTQSQELNYSIDLGLKLITSYHNYDRTPDRAELRELHRLMLVYKPNLVKFSSFCRGADEALALLDFWLELRTQTTPSLVIGMGEHGVLTRIVSLKWEAPLVFAPLLNLQASAPGQLSRPQLEVINGIFN